MAFVAAAAAAVVPFLFGIGANTGAVPVVSVVGQPDLACPSASAVERALGQLPGWDVRVQVQINVRSPSTTPPAPNNTVWTLVLARARDGVAIDLRDPTGATMLSRELGTSPARCESAAHAIAIIVERYFRDVVWAADIPIPRGAPAHALGTPPPPAAEAVPKAVPMTSPPAPAFAPAPRLVMGVGTGVWTRRGGGLSLLLDARVRLTAAICAGVGVLLPTFRSDETLSPGPGRAHISGVPIIARVAAAGRRGRLGLTAGIEALMTFERGQSVDVVVPAIEQRTVLAAGLGLGAALAVGSRFRLSADLSGFRTLLGRSFVVDGVAGPVLEPPTWQAVFGLRVEWVALS